MNGLVLAQVAGGAVLFLLGMQLLSTALRTAAGERLRVLLNAATASRMRGLALGTSVGFLAHSSAATVMTVGFVNAGLLSLAGALPVLFGANVGTTLSMQLISFRLTDYALVAVAAGGACYLAAGEGRWRWLGQAVLGLGLVFFGMKLSGDAILPYRASLEPFLARIDGASLGGILAGVALSAMVTAAVQSSGAVIGMTFVLAGSGAFTSLWQTFPIVLGAHIGTTVTAVIASLGTSAEARRAAWANVVFNLANAAMGVVLAGLWVPLLQRTSSDLVHQTANAHTLIMLVAAALLVPFTAPLARLARRIAWPNAAAPVASHLHAALLRTPEDALLATLRELGRCAGLARESFRVVLQPPDGSARRIDRQRVRHHEQAINEIKSSVRAYLASLTRGALTHRQALLAQALNRCAIEVERIGDHVDRLWKLTGEQPAGALDPEIREEFVRIAARVGDVLERVVRSFASEDLSFDTPSWEILELRNRYRNECTPVKTGVTARLARREVPATQALAFSEITTTLDRIVRHCAVIAQEQRQPAFAIKRERLGQPADADAADPLPPPGEVRS